MDSQALRTLRTTLGVSQANMANAMGMPFRSYQDIEADKNPVRGIHERAAYFAAMELVRAGSDRAALPEHVIELAAFIAKGA